MKPMFDQETEIPAAEYNNISKITRRNVVDYTLFLPHKSPEVGLTTIFSDLCVELCEPFLRAAQVGEKRRRAIAEALDAHRRAERDAARASGETASAEAVEAAVGGAGSSPAASGFDSPQPPSHRPDPGTTPRAAMPAGSPPAGGDANDEAFDSPPPSKRFAVSSPRSGGPAVLGSGGIGRPGSPPVGVLPPAGVAAEEQAVVAAPPPPPPLRWPSPGLPSPGSGSPPPRSPLPPSGGASGGGGWVPPGGPPGGGPPGGGVSPQGAEDFDLPPEIASAPPPSLVAFSPQAVSPGEVPVKEEPGTSDSEASSADLPSVAAEQAHKLRKALSGAGGDAVEGRGADVTFFGLCQSPPGGASNAAKRFISLLTLHMEGAVELQQEEDYGDIQVRRGPNFDTAWGPVES